MSKQPRIGGAPELTVLAFATVESQPANTGTTTDPGTGTTTNPSTGTTTQPTAASGGFQIDVTMAGFTAAQQAIVQQAVDLWEQIIVGDLPDANYRGQVIDDVSIAISRTAGLTALAVCSVNHPPRRSATIRCCPTWASSNWTLPMLQRCRAVAVCWASSRTKLPTCWGSA